jgi:glycosyltransferase involved in cell wall biosynthesis
MLNQLDNLSVFFAVNSVSVHDQRFIRILENNFFDVHIISSLNELVLEANILEKKNKKYILLVSGLDNLFLELSSHPSKKIAISFATDLMSRFPNDLEYAKKITKTIKNYSGFFVDTYYAKNALLALGVQSKKILVKPWIDNLQLNTNFQSSNVIRIIAPRSSEEHYKPYDVLNGIKILSESCMAKFSVDFFVNNYADQNLFEAYATNLDIANLITWREPIPEDELLGILPSYDICVSSPTTDGTSVTVLQSLAAGLIVVASETAGTHEWLINGVTGFSFPVGNVLALSDALDRAISALPDRAEYIENAHRLLIEKVKPMQFSNSINNFIRSLF